MGEVTEVRRIGPRACAGIVLVGTTAGLVGYGFAVGLDRADKLGSCVSAVVALCALGLAHLLPREGRGDDGGSGPVAARGTGSVAVRGNNTGCVRTEIWTRPRTGPEPPPVPSASAGVVADGAGSVAVGGDNHADIQVRAGDDGEDRR